MLASLRQEVANRVPSLGMVWRNWSATRDVCLPRRRSYSQHGEDLYFADLYRSWGRSGLAYVDVGANHPTRISNTYLLYRLGASGITVEPSAELAALHRRYRPRDTVVCVGGGSHPMVGKFMVSSTPVLSGFKDLRHDGSRIVRTETLPILPVDTILEAFPRQDLFLLSIDTEGFEREVLLGATEALKRTSVLCLEAGDVAELDTFRSLIEPEFVLAKTFGCNYIFRRAVH